MIKIEDDLIPQLFDNEIINFNTKLSKQLGKLYIKKIKKWYIRQFQELKKSGLYHIKSYNISISHQKIHLEYEAEDNLHEDVIPRLNRTLRLELLV